MVEGSRVTRDSQDYILVQERFSLSKQSESGFGENGPNPATKNRRVMPALYLFRSSYAVKV